MLPSLPVRVLVVDDHAVVRQGIRMFLATAEHIEIVGEASNGQEALALSAQVAPHVVLMDLNMPVMDGVTAIREVRAQHAEIEIIALTSVLEDRKVVDAVQAGATGYLLKDTDADALEAAIHAAARGEVTLHPEAAKRLARELRTPDMREHLTPRETEILKLVAHGRTNKEIARTLTIEEPTVKTHVARILAKLNLASRTQAAIFAYREGLIGVE
ncbi:response regulator transcription factor [Deinococcus sonorensis]|uniref:Response regulator transcription factor n=2 Tax=Deinococcus sonorensis TaxID=309891 RepID=A0AAU7U6P5_9DEIO